MKTHVKPKYASPKVGSRRLYKLASFLEKLPQDRFDFSNIMVEGEVTTKHICGTVCCAIGWMPKVDPKNWKWSLNRNMLSEMHTVRFVAVLNMSESLGHRRHWGSYFGLNVTEAAWLFTRGGYAMENITKEIVVKRLRTVASNLAAGLYPFNNCRVIIWEEQDRKHARAAFLQNPKIRLEDGDLYD